MTDTKKRDGSDSLDELVGGNVMVCDVCHRDNFGVLIARDDGTSICYECEEREIEGRPSLWLEESWSLYCETNGYPMTLDEYKGAVEQKGGWPSSFQSSIMQSARYFHLGYEAGKSSND